MEELCPDETCWTVIKGAASGDQRDQSTFSRKYLPVVRAYLAARWRDAALERWWVRTGLRGFRTRSE